MSGPLASMSFLRRTFYILNYLLDRKHYPTNVLAYRRARLQALHRHWKDQMPALVDAYLHHQHGNTLPQEAAREDGMDGIESTADSCFEAVAISTFGAYNTDFIATCSDYFHPAREGINVPQKPNEPANVALLRLGLLGCSPVDPAVAISLETLELYHRLRRRHGQLSIQTMARVLCDLHDVRTHSLYLCRCSLSI